jgi:hypothetical protein
VKDEGYSDVILAWDIFNEPEQIMAGNLYPYRERQVDMVPVAAMQYFVAQCSVAIHALEFKATLGSADLRYCWENQSAGNFPRSGWQPIFPGEQG